LPSAEKREETALKNNETIETDTKIRKLGLQET
jgi:hypothetical protein